MEVNGVLHAAQGHRSESVFRSGNRFLEYYHLVLNSVNPPFSRIYKLSIHPLPSHVPILENGKEGAVHKIKIFQETITQLPGIGRHRAFGILFLFLPLLYIIFSRTL